MNRSLRAIVVAVAVVVALTALSSRWWNEAPPLAFNSIRGEPIQLKTLRGHPVVVTFWASDCRPCLLEIPELDRIHKDFSPRGLRLIAIAMAYDVPSRVLSLVKQTGLGYTVALDSDARLAAGFGGVEFVPSTFLIAPDGTIRHKTVGTVDFRLVRKQIEEMFGGS